MPLFDNIEKLITEHGSAAILKERLGLASDKYAALEASAAKLQSENNELRSQLEDHYKEIERLRKLITPDDGKLSDEEEKVLTFYANAHQWIPVSYVAHHLAISQMKAQYFVERLLDENYLQSPMVIVSDHEIAYHIHQKGREYVITHDLVQ